MQSVSSGKESTYNSYLLSGEAEETMDQTQETRPVDASRNFTSNSSMELERNSFSNIPSYPNRGKEETSSRSGLNDRERGDLKPNQAGITSKTQSLQDLVNSQDVKVTKVSPPRRKANRDDKSERQSNYVKKESGPESRTVPKQQQQLKQQQLQRPSLTSAAQVSSKQSEKEDMELNAILEVILLTRIIYYLILS